MGKRNYYDYLSFIQSLISVLAFVYWGFNKDQDTIYCAIYVAVTAVLTQLWAMRKDSVK